MKRICEISHERWELLTVILVGAAGLAVAMIMEHLHWASAATKFWDESVMAMHEEEIAHGPDQGSEGQRDTQKTTDTPAGETGDTENAARGLPTESGVENGGRRSPAPGGPARGVGG